MPGKRIALSIIKPDGDFTLIQLPLTDSLELRADLPEDSKTVIQSDGEVEVKAEKLTLAGDVLITDGEKNGNR